MTGQTPSRSNKNFTTRLFVSKTLIAIYHSSFVISLRDFVNCKTVLWCVTIYIGSVWKVLGLSAVRVYSGISRKKKWLPISRDRKIYTPFVFFFFKLMPVGLGLLLARRIEMVGIFLLFFAIVCPVIHLALVFRYLQLAKGKLISVGSFFLLTTAHLVRSKYRVLYVAKIRPQNSETNPVCVSRIS